MPESKIITSESMVDNHDLRNELIARTEVLDKVKKLLLIPEMNCMTIRFVRVKRLRNVEDVCPEE